MKYMKTYILPLISYVYLPLRQSFGCWLHLAAILAAILDFHIPDGLGSF